MLNRLIAKLKNRRAASLAEMLIALLLCLLTFTMASTALSSGTAHLKKTTVQSESKVLLGTLIMAVEDELRFSGSRRAASGSGPEQYMFYSNSRPAGWRRLAVNDKGHLVLWYYGDDYNTPEADKQIRPLISDSGYTQGMTADLALNWNDTDKAFEGTIIIYDTGGTELVKESFKVEPVNVNR